MLLLSRQYSETNSIPFPRAFHSIVFDVSKRRQQQQHQLIVPRHALVALTNALTACTQWYLIVSESSANVDFPLLEHSFLPAVAGLFWHCIIAASYVTADALEQRGGHIAFLSPSCTSASVRARFQQRHFALCVEWRVRAMSSTCCYRGGRREGMRNTS